MSYAACSRPHADASASSLAAVSIATLTAADGYQWQQVQRQPAHAACACQERLSGSIITVTVHVNYTKSGLVLPDQDLHGAGDNVEM
jgi:hypothetical protein